MSIYINIFLLVNLRYVKFIFVLAKPNVFEKKKRKTKQTKIKARIIDPDENGGRSLILETEEGDVKRPNREEDDARFEALHSMTKADLFRQLRHDVANIFKIPNNLAKLVEQVVKRYEEDNQNDPSTAQAASTLHRSVCRARGFLGEKLSAPDNQRLLDDANRDMSKKFEDLDDEHQTSYKGAFLDAW